MPPPNNTFPNQGVDVWSLKAAVVFSALSCGEEEGAHLSGKTVQNQLSKNSAESDKRGRQKNRQRGVRVRNRRCGETARNGGIKTKRETGFSYHRERKRGIRLMGIFEQNRHKAAKWVKSVMGKPLLYFWVFIFCSEDKIERGVKYTRAFHLFSCLLLMGLSAQVREGC